MKIFFTTILGICCIGVLVMGTMHWKEKTANPAAPAEQGAAEETAAPLKQSRHEDVLALASHWPESSVKGLEKALEENETFHIHIVGSESLGEGPESWPEMVKEALLEAYGSELLEVTVSRYDLSSSREFVKTSSLDEMIEQKADLLLYEPFTLKDNEALGIELSLENLQTVLEAIEKESPETTVLIQPPHPIYGARMYPQQVGELKEYAEENEIDYLDHWKAWPDHREEELLEYLEDDSSEPSEKGHMLWAEFLIDYLIVDAE